MPKMMMLTEAGVGTALAFVVASLSPISFPFASQMASSSLTITITRMLHWNSCDYEKKANKRRLLLPLFLPLVVVGNACNNNDDDHDATRMWIDEKKKKMKDEAASLNHSQVACIDL